MTILIKNNKPISGILPNGYMVDGKKGKLPKDIQELEYINTTSPDLVNQVATSEWMVTRKGWERVWTVRDKTEYEMKLEDWDCPEFDKRVVAPSILAEELPSIVTYSQINPDKMCIIPNGDLARIYYNELKENHVGYIKGFGLKEEERP